jgi:hypothetical protein
MFTQVGRGEIAGRLAWQPAPGVGVSGRPGAVDEFLVEHLAEAEPFGSSSCLRSAGILSIASSQVRSCRVG